VCPECNCNCGQNLECHIGKEHKALSANLSAKYFAAIASATPEADEDNGSFSENIDSAFIDESEAEAVFRLPLVIPNYEINLEYTETQGKRY
jgi:hypothetical protein